jgi:hypothetical protein
MRGYLLIMQAPLDPFVKSIIRRTQCDDGVYRGGNDKSYDEKVTLSYSSEGGIPSLFKQLQFPGSISPGCPSQYKVMEGNRNELRVIRNATEVDKFFREHNIMVMNAILLLDQEKTNTITKLTDQITQIVSPYKKRIRQLELAERISDYEVISKNGLAKEYLANDRELEGNLLREIGMETYYLDSGMKFKEFAKWVMSKHNISSFRRSLMELADDTEKRIILYRLNPTLFKLDISMDK